MSFFDEEVIDYDSMFRGPRAVEPAREPALDGQTRTGVRPAEGSSGAIASATKPPPLDVVDTEQFDSSKPRSYAGLLPPVFPAVYHPPQLRFRYDPRKYDYDVAAELAKSPIISVTREDRMPVSEAKKKLDLIHKRMRLDSVVDRSIVTAFDSALWFCHTLNSASVQVPGRSTFEVPGYTHKFKYGEVMAILGTDARRFFRAYADDITETNKRVLNSLDPADPISVENWSWLIEVATDRGIYKYPYLAHDSADACMYLSNTERIAVLSSRDYVIDRDKPMASDSGGTKVGRATASTVDNWRDRTDQQTTAYGSRRK